MDAWRHPEYQLWQAGWKVMGAFKKFSCQNQQEWKRPTARRRSDREHLPLVLLRSCWCKYKTAQMEIWLQSYLTFSSYKLVWCLAIDFWAAYILSLAFPCHLWILVQQVADSVFCTHHPSSASKVVKVPPAATAHLKFAESIKSRFWSWVDSRSKAAGNKR